MPSAPSISRRNPDQMHASGAAAEAPPLREHQLERVAAVYDRLIRLHVHER